MSSTNRSDARNEHVADYYVTPPAEIDKFLKEFKKIVRGFKNFNILDPCAGGDTVNPMSYPVVLRQHGCENITTIDIREDSLAEIKEDYLQVNVNLCNCYDMIITNPPFNLALPIIEKALFDVRVGGYVIMLLRLNFFGTKARKPFFDKYMPKYAFVHNKRMSFTKGGGTDSIEYMHCVWQKNDYPEFAQLKVI